MILEQLATTPVAILVGAALLEAILPWPSHLRLSALVPLLTRLGHKVCRADGSPRQQVQAGLLAILVVWLPCASGLWAIRNLSLSEPLFDLLFLLLMLESRPLRELSRTIRMLTKENLAAIRLQLAPWVKRDTGTLSIMGVAKAASESAIMRLVGQWAGPLIGFALAGVQGALLWRFAQLMNQSWNPKQSTFSHFGRAAALLHQALCAPAILLLALPLCLSQLRQLTTLFPKAVCWPYPMMGCLLALLSRSFDIRLGGPRYYQGSLIRFPVFDATAEPATTTPQILLNYLQRTGWGWLLLASLLTLWDVLHG